MENVWEAAEKLALSSSENVAAEVKWRHLASSLLILKLDKKESSHIHKEVRTKRDYILLDEDDGIYDRRQLQSNDQDDGGGHHYTWTNLTGKIVTVVMGDVPSTNDGLRNFKNSF